MASEQAATSSLPKMLLRLSAMVSGLRLSSVAIAVLGLPCASKSWFGELVHYVENAPTPIAGMLFG